MSSVLTSILEPKFLGAIFSTVFIILLGYYARKKNIVDANAAKTLSNIMLSLALPALAIKAFITDITKETFTTGLSVFVFGFIAYVLLIVISELVYSKVKGDKKTTLSVLTTFGSTTFFGIPIIDGVFGKIGTIYANIFNIAYRVFLYSYGLIRMSGVKFEKKNFKLIFGNPIIIATFVGLLIWLFQGYLPQVDVTVAGKTAHYAFLRIDKTAPWLFKGIEYLGGLSSPLAWLAIGMTLANISLDKAVKEKFAWIYSGIKLLFIPAIFVVIMLVIKPILPLSYEAVMAVTIMLATPPATVAVAYAIKFEKDPILASNISLLATVFAVVAIIFWLIIGTTVLKVLF